MAKKINEVAVETKKAVGVADPAKTQLYDDVAQFIANQLGVDVSHVKPRTYKDDEGNKKRTGAYGLFFELDGRPATLEIVLKSDTVTIEDFGVTATTKPD